MKLRDALNLSWSNIAQHKSRSAVLILTISILFGVVMGFNFLLEGLGQTTFDAALQASEGKIYIATGYNEISSINEGDYTKVESLEAAQQLITENIERYNGQIVGEISQYNIADSRWTINQALAERFSTLELGKLQENQIPYVAPKIEDDEFNRWLKDPDGAKDKLLVKVGTYPATEPGHPTLPGFNPLNLLLSGVYGSYKYPLMIDDGSDRITQYLEQQAEQIPSHPKVTPYLTNIVAMFDNYETALTYYWDTTEGKNIPKDIETLDGTKFSLYDEEIFSSVISAQLGTRNLRLNLVLIEILFIIVAVIIAALTFAHLIDQDAATIALYRSLGASRADIYLIYFLYLLELCLLAVAACIGLALILVLIIWLFNASPLATRLQAYYMLSMAPKVILFGFNGIFWWIILAIILLAPITLLLTLSNFSAKHIAKKLKED